MKNAITITTKRQLTIPIDIFENLGLSRGDKLSAYIKDESIILKPQNQIINELSGKLKLSSKHKGKSINKIIKDSKLEYLKKKYGRIFP